MTFTASWLVDKSSFSSDLVQAGRYRC